MHRRLTALLLLLTLAGAAFWMQACSDAEDFVAPSHYEGLNNIDVPEDFDYETTKSLHMDITVQNVDGSPAQNCIVTVFHGDPQDTLIEILRIGRGVTNQSGRMLLDVNIPTYMTEVYITANVLGVPNQGYFTAETGSITHVFGPNTTMSVSSHRGPVNKPQSGRNTWSHDWQYLGTWDDDGVPDYLADYTITYSQDFYDGVGDVFQEYINLTGTHPEYFGHDVENNLNFTCDIDSVVVTFIHDGASYQNAIGFYPYPWNQPPPGITQLQPKLVIFPNASFTGQGGNLANGATVVLQREEFNQNYSMGFFIVGDGWTDNPDMVGQGLWTNWSVDRYNPRDLRHFVLLHDSANEQFIVGIEDWKRNQHRSDSDFNDVIMVVKPYPFCVDTTNIPNIDLPSQGGPDTDGDGVEDDYDDYPDDPDKAFDNQYQSVVAFEDLWPSSGNYDMNDLVMLCEINQITNGDNLVAFIEADFTIKAVGADYDNGFAIEIPIAPSDILSFTGSDCNGTVFNYSDGQPEAGQEYAVIPVFDRTKDLIEPEGNWAYINTEYGAPVQASPTTHIVLEITPTSPEVLGAPPYNPFIVVNGDRTKEVHLAGYEPTTLADPNWFGQDDDTSSPATERYYKDSDNLPWAVVVPTDWQHMMAGEEITAGYLYFRTWAESGGTVYMDWYEDIPGYQDDSVLWDSE